MATVDLGVGRVTPSRRSRSSGRRGGRRRVPRVAPYLFVLPNMLAVGLFAIWPAINGFLESLRQQFRNPCDLVRELLEMSLLVLKTKCEQDRLVSFLHSLPCPSHTAWECWFALLRIFAAARSLSACCIHAA